MLVFLTNGDSTAVDSVITYEIPDIVEASGEIYPVGEIVINYDDQTALDLMLDLPVTPLSHGYGIWGTVMNKGLDPSYTHISVNGHRLNTFPHGYFNLGMLPLHFFDRLIYGKTAGGVEFSGIDFASKINRYERPYSLAHFMFGSFESNTYNFDLTRGITNELGFYLSGSYHKTDGHRENSDTQILSLYSNIYVNYLLPFRFDMLYINDDYGFPGSTAMPVEGRQKDEFLDVSGMTRLGKGILTLFYERQVMDYRDTTYDRTWGVKVDHFGVRSEAHDTLLGISLTYGASAFLTQTEGESYLSDALNGFDLWIRSERTIGRGFVRAAGKLERSKDNDYFLFPGFELGMNVLGSTEAYAALSSGGRSPSEMEKWAPFDPLNPYLTVRGNEFLTPEHYWCAEVGLREDGFTLSMYRLTFTDRIMVFPEMSDHYIYYNVDTREIQGVEGCIKLPLRVYSADSSGMSEFSAGLRGNVIMNSDTVPYYPRVTAGSFAAFKRETPRFGLGFTLRAEYCSEISDISGREYAGYTVFSVAGLVKFLSLSCVLRVNNVFDEDYAYVPLYPMPPRNFSVSVKWEFWD